MEERRLSSARGGYSILGVVAASGGPRGGPRGVRSMSVFGLSFGMALKVRLRVAGCDFDLSGVGEIGNLVNVTPMGWKHVHD